MLTTLLLLTPLGLAAVALGGTGDSIGDEPNLTTGDVAKTLGIGVSTAAKLADDGRIKCVRIVSGRKSIRRFRPSWIKAFIESQTSG